ncbi:DUF1802 family protein [Phycisphaeraceae bacterium D3-23]
MELDIALKEWSVVCDFLAEGKSCLLLRKGGVHEHAGPGRFDLAYQRFLMFPAWEHERLDWIKPDWLSPAATARLEQDAAQVEPTEITFRSYGEVAGIWQVPSREAFDQLDDLHGWLPPQVDMRFSYKPERPLYLIAVRALRLREPATVAYREAYGGCVSWVPLPPSDAVDVGAARRAIPEGAFESILERVDRAMG